MINLGTWVFEIANILLLTSWVVLAFLLWRVRRTKVLRGGECIVVSTLLTFALVRALQILDYRPWEMPTIMGAVSGLTIISTLIVGNALNRYAEREKAVEELELKLSPETRELFSSLRKVE